MFQRWRKKLKRHDDEDDLMRSRTSSVAGDSVTAPNYAPHYNVSTSSVSLRGPEAYNNPGYDSLDNDKSTVTSMKDKYYIPENEANEVRLKNKNIQ